MSPRVLTAAIGAAIVLLTACSGDAGSGEIPVVPDRPTTTTTIAATAEDVEPLASLDTEIVASGLSEPVAIASAPALDETFVVERTGRLVTLSSGGSSAVLDITSRVGWEVNEQGFLGFAVHPSFPDDPRGFAAYTNLDRDLVIESFAWNGRVFDISSRTPVLVVEQPHKYHQGGGLVFDDSGTLFISLGDGGGGGDKRRNGQNTETLLGTIVRIDVDAAEPYAIPETNPFVGSEEGRSEIWAYGLRNPWRIAFDAGQLIVVDVGDAGGDEINVVPADAPGLNYGWSIVEGDACFRDPGCDMTGFVEPAHVIERTRTCAVIGGPVYRGSAIPELHGHLVFGDFCVGWVRSAEVVPGGLGPIVSWEPDIGTLGMITTFGTDADGELLVATIEGEIHRFVPVRTS